MSALLILLSLFPSILITCFGVCVWGVGEADTTVINWHLKACFSHVLLAEDFVCN